MAVRDVIAARIKRFVVPEPDRAIGPCQAKVLAVCASKGGVGKTTTAVHLGAGLAALRGFRTLIVDLDPQGHVGASLRAVVPPRSGRLAGLLMSEEKGEVMDVVVPTAIPRLHVTAPDRGLANADKALAARIGREHLLRRALQRTRTHYDFIVLDCPPNLGNLTINALLAADALIVPCDPSVLSLQGVEDLLRTVELVGEQLSHRPQLLGILRTKVDRRNELVHEATAEALATDYSRALFDTEIRVNTTLAQAQIAGTPVWHVARSSRGARDYASLVDEVLFRLEMDQPAN
jgi:chromosome partitioning protein